MAQTRPAGPSAPRPRRPVALIVVVVATALSALAAPTAPAYPPGPPVVTETFTLLPCSPARTTLGIEGCAEHRLLRLDKQVNTLSRRIYYTLTGAAARRAFVAAAHRWVRSRRAECLRESAAFAGGTFRPLAFANCEAARDRARIGYLTHRLGGLRAPGR